MLLFDEALVQPCVQRTEHLLTKMSRSSSKSRSVEEI